ncbi:MAG TPA: twin-arginine translocase subunit TatC, partial [Candidatus Binatia bacterium]|nr:twin-arginine translocase subunit TatC [Candidatus Binatia bacterium]
GAVKLFPIMDFYNIVFFTVIISGVLFMIPAFFVLLVKFGIVGTKSVTKNRKYIYAGLGIAAMLISPGATPLGDLYLFVALIALVEVSVFIGKRYEHKNKTADSQSLLSKWISPPKICKFCDSQIQESARFCPNCKRYTM